LLVGESQRPECGKGCAGIDAHGKLERWPPGLLGREFHHGSGNPGGAGSNPATRPKIRFPSVRCLTRRFQGIISVHE
jgi:hypothetical protein